MMDDRGKEIAKLSDKSHVNYLRLSLRIYTIPIIISLILLVFYIPYLINVKKVEYKDYLGLLSLFMVGIGMTILFTRLRLYLQKNPNSLFENGILLTPLDFFKNKQTFILFKDILSINYSQYKKFVRLEINLENKFFFLFVDDLCDYYLIMDNMNKSNLKIR